MKKVFSVLTVAVLAVSTVFAGFSGSFETQYKADFAGENYGFLNGTTNKLELKFDKVLGGTANENPITGKIVAEIAPKVDKEGDINLGLSIKDASIVGDKWSVNLVKMAGVGDLANDVVPHFGEDADGEAGFFGAKLNAEVKTTNGVTAEYDGWKLGIGMNIVNSVPEKAAEWEFDKFVGVKAGDKYYDANGEEKTHSGAPAMVATYKNKNAKSGVKGTKELAATFNMKQLAFLEDSLKLDAYAGAYAAGKKDIDLGFGAKVAYAQDKISASVASDVVVLVKDKTTVEADVAANFAYDFVNAGLYYATKGVSDTDDTAICSNEDVLDIALGVDLASLNVPVAIDFTLSDLLEDEWRALSLGVTSEFMEGAKVGASYYQVLGEHNKLWMAEVSGEYNLENIAKFSAALNFMGADELASVGLTVAAENTTLIENTTLKLAYASENFKDKDAAAGALTASVKVAF